MLDGVEAELVGRAVDDAALDAAAGQPGAEALRMMVAAVALAPGRAAELRAPDDERLVQQAAPLEVLQQPGDRQIDLRRQLARGCVLMPRVRVPRAAAAAAVEDLHEAHAALDQPPGRQAELAERLRGVVVQAVELAASRPSRAPAQASPARPSACRRPARSDLMRARSAGSSG